MSRRKDLGQTHESTFRTPTQKTQRYLRAFGQESTSLCIPRKPCLGPHFAHVTAEMVVATWLRGGKSWEGRGGGKQ